MELQLKKIFSIFLFIILLSCSKKYDFNGNWGIMDEMNYYSEMEIKMNSIRVYSEIAGYIPSLTYSIKGDSLFTNILNYKIIEINRDSIILDSEKSSLYLKRIKKGFKLSDFTNQDHEDKYRDSFYDRMYKRKGIKPETWPLFDIDHLPKKCFINCTYQTGQWT